MKIKKSPVFPAALAVLLSLATVSLRAGNIYIVNLPTNGTDLATGIPNANISQG